ncbi:glutamyl-tRNA reductase [Leucobacter sp. M11]|uniref:glutamyl-tRNA reductase n=1 Tax=Leucobacter sp. M11 TaxID=2993565 RepID=UPI002D801032|nr:glutamyl-tRNA reductase [Leucobacter sp. M11]MEB4614145.1 glutamyl-tRNA reductase [Leucobacter sp. M11]
MLLCLTASHKNASFDFLERFGAVPSAMGRALLSGVAGVRGSVVIATCNRFEVYLELNEAARDRPELADHAEARASALIAREAGIDAQQLDRVWGRFRGDAAARHLFAVSAGLESVAVGEGEIAGQVRRSLERAREAGTTSSELERLFQRASQTSRGIKNATGLAGVGRSLVRLGLDLAESRIEDWPAMRVLLIGTGAYAGASLAALRDRGVTEVAVYSPSNRARSFAESHHVRPVFAEHFLAEIADANVIITCTTAEGTVLDAELLRRGRGVFAPDLPALDWDETPGCPIAQEASQVVIDLGLPRNVDPDVAGLPGVELIDLETIRVHAPLQDVLADQRARQLVDRAATKFTKVAAEQRLAPEVVALREYAAEILDSEIDRIASKDRDGVAEGALRHLMARLLHQPTVRARAYARAGQTERYRDALDTLFGIRLVADEDAVPAGDVAGDVVGNVAGDVVGEVDVAAASITAS